MERVRVLENVDSPWGEYLEGYIYNVTEDEQEEDGSVTIGNRTFITTLVQDDKAIPVTLDPMDVYVRGEGVVTKTSSK
ncbi:MAG: hypothetical protein KAI07_00915 [Deltaproteobacteria bacterium]|nr:hypothetical protein [Deltaproteobacteria bacterium]